MPDDKPPPRKPARITAAGRSMPPAPIQGRPVAARRSISGEEGQSPAAENDEQSITTRKLEPVNSPAPPVKARPSQPPQPPVVRRPSPPTAAQVRAETSTVPAAAAVTPGRSSTLWALRNKYRWALGLAAFGVALYAQKIASDDRAATNGLGTPPLLSWLLFGLAALIFVLAIPATPTPATSPAAPFRVSLRSLKKKRLFLILIGAAIACGVIALPLFLALNGAPVDRVEPQGWFINTGSWLLYITALLLFGAAWVVWERNTPATDERPPTSNDGEQSSAQKLQSAVRMGRWSSLVGRRSSVEWIGMAAIFVLALLLRLPNLDSTPPGIWFDEAQNGIVGRDLLAPNAIHPSFLAAYTQMGAFYFYMVGIVGKLFGDTLLWPVRLLPALSGALIAPMLYLIGSRLYGWRVGAVAGVLVAVSSWNITFSRFGMASLPTVALDVAAYLCLLQALRTGRLGYYAAGGVLVGLALQMYYVSQLTPVVFGLVFLYRLVSERARFWRSVRSGVGLFVAAAILAFLPVGTFAIQHPEVYSARTGTVSIFTPEGSDGRPDALGISLSKHALMFNYAGDNNGRHNLPGEPMLDWWTGALFIAGVGVCLLRIRRWHYFYPLVWLAVSMAGGVLSVVFEAPQAHRTLESSVVVSLIAGIFLGELAGVLIPTVKMVALSTRRNALAVGTSFALLVPLLGLAGAASINRYFNLQMNNQNVWEEMLGTDSMVGQYLAKYGSTHKIYISPIKANYPTSTFLAPNVEAIPWPGMYYFPLTEDRDTEIILTPSDGSDVSLIKRTYPNAVVEVTYGPNKVTPKLFSITIPASDIRAVRGVQARIYPGDTAKQAVDEVLPEMSFEASGANTGANRVRLSTTLKIGRYADYAFKLADAAGADTAGDITIDGFSVQSGTPISLTTGLHSVVVTSTLGFPTEGLAPGIRLLWDDNTGQGMHSISSAQLFDPRKVQPHGLTALIRNGDGFEDPPAVGRIDPSISFYFHLTPLKRPYTIEWVGKLYVPVMGTYIFSTEQISTSRLFIDGKQVIDNPDINKSVSASVELQQGLHDIRLLYQDHDGSSHVYLLWAPPGLGGNYIIPSAFLLPAMGQYATQPEYGQWPDINQADDTEWPLAAEAQQGTTTTTAGGQPQSQPTQPPLEQQPTQQPQPAQPTQPALQNSRTAAPVEGQSQPKTIQPLLTLGKEGDKFERPKAAAVDDSGDIYLYTEIDGKIRKFGPDGKLQKEWVVTGADGKPATEISALLIKGGKLLALDAATSELVNYTLEGEGGERAKICECFFPRGIALSNDGNFWITDTGGARVLKSSPDGKVLAMKEGNGPSLGQFVEPSGVWESPGGILYVSDIGNSRIQELSADLNPITAWAMGSSVARDGNRVSGDAGGVLVTEYAGRAVVRYDANGRELSRWEYNSSGGSEASIPAGIAPAGNGKFVVIYPFDNMAVLFDASK